MPESPTLTLTASGVVIDSLGRRWNPVKHPRDRKGRFIETFAEVRAFLKGKGYTKPDLSGRVVAMDSDGTALVQVRGGRGPYAAQARTGALVRVPISSLETADDIKARLSPGQSPTLRPLSDEERARVGAPQPRSDTDPPEQARADLEFLESAAQAAEDAQDTATRDALLDLKSVLRGDPSAQDTEREAKALLSNSNTSTDADVDASSDVWYPDLLRAAESEPDERRDDNDELAGVFYGPMREVSRDEALAMLAERKERFGEGYGIPPAWGDRVLVAEDYLNPKLGKIAGKVGGGSYVYTPLHTRTQAAAKFARIDAVLKDLPKFEQKAVGDALNGNVTALVALMLLRTGMRVSSSSERNPRRKEGAFGATSLQARHVSFSADGKKVVFKFTGKANVPNVYSSDDPALVAALNGLIEGKSRYEPLFPTVNSNKVIEYLKANLRPDAKNHDLRTIRANAVALELISQINRKRKDGRPKTPAEFRKRRKQVADGVGVAINDKPATALGSYINPIIFEDWRESVGAEKDKWADVANPAPGAAPAPAPAPAGGVVASGRNDSEIDAIILDVVESANTNAGMAKMVSALRMFVGQHEGAFGDRVAPPSEDED